MDSMSVAVVGAGYVGLTTGVCLAYVGHRVSIVEIDDEKVATLRAGQSPIHEDGLEELMHDASSRLSYSTSTDEAVPEADVILIAVGTPCRQSGQADNRFVESAVRQVSSSLQPDRAYTLVVKSTVPVGSNRRVAHLLHSVLSERGLDVQIAVRVASNPEFLREGTALQDMLYPDRIVIGSSDPKSTDILHRLYQPILEQTFVAPLSVPRPDSYELPPLVTTDPISAELIKYAANAFLAMKISFINEVAGLCERVGGSITEVARGMGLDSRIGPRFLRAGLGWGGSCFPKDTAALVAMGKELSCPMKLVEATREVNAAQRRRLVERLQQELKGLRGRVVGVLGLSFKPGTDDVRESPALEIVRALVDREAHVRVHDPVAMENARFELEGVAVEFASNALELATGADAIVLATEWPEYRAIDLHRLAEGMRIRVLMDARNQFDQAQAVAAGFRYLAVGR